MKLNEIYQYLKSKYPSLNLHVSIDERNIVFLSGDCPSWKIVTDIGHEVANLGEIKSVVNELTVNGNTLHKKDYSPYLKAGKKIGVIDSVDVIIVGAGIIGSGIARELSKFKLNIALLEKNDDIACEATKANNGDIHSGYLEKPGTLKAKLNVKGNAMYDTWAEELNFNFIRKGNLLVINDEKYMCDLELIQERANANQVPCELIDGKKIQEMEPLTTKFKKPPYAGLYVPSMATVDPWEVAISLAENAVINGVKIYLGCTVADVLKDNNGITGVITNKGIINTKYIINCAGVYADEISEMAGDKCYSIHPRKGTIAIIDKNIPAYERPFRLVDENHRMISTKNSKGGGMATTISKNNLLGPSSTEVPDKEDMETTPEGLATAMDRSSIDDIGYNNVIRFFSGTRPATYTEDFYIALSEKTDRFINVGGIQSPGLAAAPAIAELAISLLTDNMKKNDDTLLNNPNFNPYLNKKIEFSKLSREEQDRLIKNRPEYGKIICRCETISEGEILDVIHSPIVPITVDAIKRRTRAGMGRCQGGFCQPKVLELLARELGQKWTDITLKGKESHILLSSNRKAKEDICE